jgi:hypothetical protein
MYWVHSISEGHEVHDSGILSHKSIIYYLLQHSVKKFGVQTLQLKRTSGLLGYLKFQLMNYECIDQCLSETLSTVPWDPEGWNSENTPDLYLDDWLFRGLIIIFTSHNSNIILWNGPCPCPSSFMLHHTLSSSFFIWCNTTLQLIMRYWISSINKVFRKICYLRSGIDLHSVHIYPTIKQSFLTC